MRRAVLLCIGLLCVAPLSVSAEEATTSPRIEPPVATTNDDLLKSLQAKIDQYQKQLDALGEEKKTLQSAINALSLTQQKLAAQIQITERKIASANLEISQLTGSIKNAEETIGNNKLAMSKALRSMSHSEHSSLVAHLFSSSSLQQAWSTVDESIQLNNALLTDIAELRSTQATLTANREKVAKTKATLVSLQNDLQDQKRSVAANKAAEQDLLAETKNQESSYQKLLATAKAELESFSVFAQNAGGSKLLRDQTSCDDWGCYYSQRDVLWGNVPLNKTRFRLASDGCLVTAMAMVFTHYGYRSVTPLTINSNPSNFASYYPPYLLFTIRADGATAVRTKISTIDTILEKGDPVVVGVHAYGGTHYVVLTSGSRGNYRMRDPYIANGKDISFTAHYPLNSIFSIAKVSITG